MTGGIGKGAKFLGEGISKAHNKVRGPQEEEATENAQKKAAIGVGGKRGEGRRDKGGKGERREERGEEGGESVERE